LPHWKGLNITDLQAYIRALRGPILVTGASGFVGANLFKTLTAVRDDVYAIVHREKSWRLVEVKDERVIAVDLNDYAAAKNLINSVAPQTVFDCAAYGAYSFEEDANLIYQTNFQSIVNFVGLIASQPFAAFIHAGSSSEYGTNCAAPSEDSVCEPNSPYAVSKVAVASYLRFMGKQHGFPCVSLRLYSVYGPLEDTSRLLPNLLRQALAGKLPPLVDPRTSRDFIHVDDVCAAFIMAAAKMHPGLYGENFNIGTGIKTPSLSWQTSRDACLMSRQNPSLEPWKAEPGIWRNGIPIHAKRLNNSAGDLSSSWRMGCVPWLSG
jgi:nucleoside-diphosphate-sugar epimerase